MNRENLETRVHYASIVSEQELPKLWKRYLIALAINLFGDDYDTGDAFLMDSGCPGLDPVQAAEKQPDLTEAKRLEQKASVLRAQVEMCLPLIEIERAAFIRAEHGRLATLMGVEHWDEKAGESQIFHPLLQEEKDNNGFGNPYDLTLKELALLPALEKKVPRLGTFSYFKLFDMFQQDRERLPFLSRIWYKLTHSVICASTEMSTLFESHDEYLAFKLADTVSIIK